MTKEQRYLIQILNDFIHHRKSTVPEELDLAQLQRYGKNHEILGIIFYQTGLSQFRSAYLYTIYAYEVRRNWASKLTETLSCPWFFVKGLEVAELYPVPALRTMGDCDLVVHPQDRETVHRILLEQKFENSSKQPDREWQYYKNNMEFELHDFLIYAENVNEPKQEAFFNDFWQYVDGNKLNWNFHFLYLIAHLRKHFMNKGCGLRPFMDIAIVVNTVELDWAWIENKSKEIDLFPFLKNVLGFCAYWFSIQLPVAFAEQSTDEREEFFRLSAEKILADGIFGFDNKDNQYSDAINIYRKKGIAGALAGALREVFPSYTALSTTPKYSFVQGKRYFVPAGWVYRIFSERKKLSLKVNALKGNFVNAKLRKEREDLYSKWGL